MSDGHTVGLDASMLSAFAASLSALPSDEVRKAKLLFIKNAIADYRMALKAQRGIMIIMGILCIIPVFLVVFIPGYLGYKAAKENGRAKIMNAIEIWGDELGDEKAALIADLDARD